LYLRTWIKSSVGGQHGAGWYYAPRNYLLTLTVILKSTASLMLDWEVSQSFLELLLRLLVGNFLIQDVV
jgi:hypothetical protein